MLLLSSIVNRALQGGWLVNRETRKGYPAKLALGAPLPEQVSALPAPERLRELFECSNRPKGEERPPSPLGATVDAANGDREPGADDDEGEWTR